MKWYIRGINILDEWSIVHCLGCYFLATLFYALWGWAGFVITIIIGIGYEFLEARVARKGWSWHYPTWVPIIGGMEVFDSGGGDISDCILDIIGVSLAIYIILTIIL